MRVLLKQGVSAIFSKPINQEILLGGIKRRSTRGIEGQFYDMMGIHIRGMCRFGDDDEAELLRQASDGRVLYTAGVTARYVLA
jgi:hypothetical protein